MTGRDRQTNQPANASSPMARAGRNHWVIRSPNVRRRTSRRGAAVPPQSVTGSQDAVDMPVAYPIVAPWCGPDSTASIRPSSIEAIRSAKE